MKGKYADYFILTSGSVAILAVCLCLPLFMLEHVKAGQVMFSIFCMSVAAMFIAMIWTVYFDSF